MRRDEPSPPEARGQFGSGVLGPIFAAFGYLLLSESRANRIVRLAFVARDGEFLREVTERFAYGMRALDAPAMEYIYLSRLSTALPQHDLFGEAAFIEASVVRAGQMDAAAFLGEVAPFV